MSKINIMGLGGLNENGKNLYTVKVDDKLFIFDCGMKYAPDLSLECGHIMIK